MAESLAPATPGPEKVALIYARFADWLPYRESLRSYLSPDEAGRSARFRRHEDADRFETGRGFLRLVLGKLSSRAPSDLSFEYSSHGKPSLSGGIPFNLSHTRDYLMLILGGSGLVGADVEDTSTDIDANDLAAQILSEREARVFSMLPETERRSAFFRAWTIKEAWLKATGKGFSLSPVEVEIVSNSAAAAEFAAEAVWGSHETYRVASFAIGGTNSAAIVIPASAKVIEAQTLIPEAGFFGIPACQP